MALTGAFIVSATSKKEVGHPVRNLCDLRALFNMSMGLRPWL